MRHILTGRGGGGGGGVDATFRNFKANVTFTCIIFLIDRLEVCFFFFNFIQEVNVRRIRCTV